MKAVKFLKKENMNSTKHTLGEGYADDGIIIELYWQRDESAIVATDRKYGKYLYVIAYNILRDSMDSEESLNDTYLCAWNRIPPARPTVLQVFLSKIARDIAVDKYRKRTAARRVPSELISSLEELDDCLACANTVEAEMLAREGRRVLNSYLRSLSKKEEFIFVCRYYYADSISSIADMLNVSESTVFRSLARMRKGLKERLVKEGLINE